MIKNRSLKILDILIENKEISIEKLATKFGLSTRMIRYDIDELNNFFRGNKFPQIEKKANTPIRLNINKSQVNKLYKILKEMSSDIYIFSNDERVGIILYELLSRNKTIKYKYIEDLLKISRSTVLTDINKVKKWLEKYSISVNKFSNKGIKIDGNDKEIRNAFRKIMTDKYKFNILNILEKVYDKQSSTIIETINGTNMFEEDLEYIKLTIRNFEAEIGILTDEAFMDIVVSIVIIINDIGIKQNNKFDEYKIIEVENKNEYNIARKILLKIKKRFIFELETGAINYLALRIIAASKIKENIYSLRNRFEAINIADEIIDRFKKIYSQNFSMDINLYNSYLNHIKSMIFRIKYDIKTDNLMLDSIKEKYLNEFNIVKDICSLVLKCDVGEDEIAYITLYIGVAIENFKVNTNKRKKILLVCSTGLATSRLLEYKIKQLYNVEIVGITSIHNINEYIEKTQLDLIISTIKIDSSKLMNIDNVIINNIFSDKEINQLRDFLSGYENGSGVCNSNLDEILKIIDRTCTINNKDKLIEDLNNFMNSEEFNILNFLDKESIQLNVQVEDWKMAIKVAAKPMFDKGVINENYINEMIANVEKYGPYIIIDDFIAMPHASEDEVNSSGVTITTFKNPITILDSDEVKMFITIAVKDNREKFITNIMKIIENKKLINTIFSSKDSLDVLQDIKVFNKNVF